jgi:(2Fe-2S) ferredoxin
MNKPEYHFFVCNSFRLTGDPQGACNRKDAVSLLQHLEDEIIDRGLNAMVSSTGCLKMCEMGPIMVLYPAGLWFSEVTKSRIDAVLDAIEDGASIESLAVA